MSLKVIESGSIRQIVYGFLLVYLGNFVPKTHHTHAHTHTLLS